ncbi:MAG TPA: alpha-amylase, partial [Planctomycetaceae bacterium]|nr:alpha-amylase [Planctomycetaceae bacterium]
MSPTDPLRAQLGEHLSILYPDDDIAPLIERVIAAFQDTGYPKPADLTPAAELWTERDCLVITYGDSILNKNERPLRTLHRFLNTQLHHTINAVHILPFYPFSSDDGFSVIDYTSVRDDLGTWEDVQAIAADYKLMADVVINHTSSESEWFQAFLRNEPPYDQYFIQAKIDDDLSHVVRPRATPLLRAVETADGVRQVWCTFGHDQIDLNFACPDLLVDVLTIIASYLKNGVQILRLDAIGYLWKEPGTTCIHLPQTHEFVRLIRTLCDHFASGIVLITETNVPNHENLTYFGNRNEAHAIYNFSLAPLLVHSLLSGTSQYLKRWMMSMPPAPDDCAYLNFTASHDGIGMRPAEGLLSDQEQMELVETIRRHGGRFSTRRAPDGTERIYEVNVSLFEAMKGTVKGEDEHQVARFIASQTIPLGVEGIPAVYIHSLLAT